MPVISFRIGKARIDLSVFWILDIGELEFGVDPVGQIERG